MAITPDKRRAYENDRYQNDPEYRERRRAARRRYYETHRQQVITKETAAQKAKRETDPEYRAKHAARTARSRENARKKVFDHYGWSCACCGSDDRISIDHINGDGKEHRTELFGNRPNNPDAMCRWLIKNGFPEGFQTLCTPCNASKNNGPACRIRHCREARLMSTQDPPRRHPGTGRAVEVPAQPVPPRGFQQPAPVRPGPAVRATGPPPAPVSQPAVTNRAPGAADVTPPAPPPATPRAAPVATATAPPAVVAPGRPPVIAGPPAAPSPRGKGSLHARGSRMTRDRWDRKKR